MFKMLMSTTLPLGLKLAHSLSEKEIQYKKGATVVCRGVLLEFCFS